MNVSRFARTIIWLKPSQVLGQIKNRIYTSRYKKWPLPNHIIPQMQTEAIPRYRSLDGDVFTFLNKSVEFTDWNYNESGNLFTYNLTYFDFINQEGLQPEVACYWIDSFISNVDKVKLGMDPYPIALRCVNWVKFFCRHPDCLTEERDTALYSQYQLLWDKLEYHLLGNHLLEDLFALYMCANFYQDKKNIQRACRLLLLQMREQTLNDGSHFERSPMYHCILLDRLLDCINIAPNVSLENYASIYLGWLREICYTDETWPMFYDSAALIAPSVTNICAYASRLGIHETKMGLRTSGYRKFINKRVESFVNVGNITASYQPGHSHADTLNYEMRIDGNPFVVDTGISTYEKNARRQYERSTAAHNTVSVADKDSSEVWGGFRVGRRAFVKIHEEGQDYIVASHNGFAGVKCTRTFKINELGFVVKDEVGPGVKAKSFIHFAPGVEVHSVDAGRICTSVVDIEIQNADDVAIVDEYASVAYNALRPIKKAIISFTGNLNYKILS